ncbi:hypothetical protein P692DRAFT_20836594, partial [Suillus brevipes Sb2]
MAINVHTLNVSSPPWIYFSGSRLRTGRRVVSSGWCPWAEGTQYQHPGGEIFAIVPNDLTEQTPKRTLRRSIGTC